MSTDVSTRKRDPKGIPSGGEFAAEKRGESEVDLLVSQSAGADEGFYGAIADRDERAEQMKTDLHNAVMDLVSSGKLGDYLEAMRLNRANHWSTSNRVLAGIQLARREGLKDPNDIVARIRQLDCGSFKQWQARGRTPVKGSKALYVYAPVTAWRTEKDKNDPSKEVKRKIMVGVKPMATFDVSQTEGDPVPQSLAEPFTGKVAEGTVPAMKQRVTELGYECKEQVIPGCDPVKLTGTLAYVRPTTKELVVDERLTDEEKASALAHELGHIECGHTEGDIAEYHQHRGRMETEAEAFAYMMMRERGVEAKEAEAFAPGYIAGWSRGDSKTVTQALDRASKAFRTSRDAMWASDGDED